MLEKSLKKRTGDAISRPRRIDGVSLAILAVLSGGLATAAQARDFKSYPENWVCAFGYNAGGRMVWVYGDTVQWKPDAIASAQRACRGRSGKCVSLGCFRRL